MLKFKLYMGLLIASATLAGCATSPPQKPDDLCEIFYEHRDWYDAAADARDKWGVPIHIPMAMMYQESSFKSDAQPPMEYFLGFIPIGRASSAYGYSQAKTMTWDDYKRETGNGWADRDDFEDAIDFMGWFIYKTHKINGVSKWDANKQYLNYHEGWGGYRKKTYSKKKWLQNVALKVQRRAETYGAQLKRCEEDLQSGWLWRLFFG
ncbi:lipoprotein [Catenovulum agarivorans]|uniref:transglycosylase SLT domain-containing protein n=1 Tax=Catenovulum agarivorans TaxID=1172192 RepID=UPI00058C7CB1|nr:lipoprotein [Catenovulum agarivorans]